MTKMTPEQRQAARKRCEAATDAPTEKEIQEFYLHSRSDLRLALDALDEKDEKDEEIERLKRELRNSEDHCEQLIEETSDDNDT